MRYKRCRYCLAALNKIKAFRYGGSGQQEWYVRFGYGGYEYRGTEKEHTHYAFNHEGCICWQRVPRDLAYRTGRIDKDPKIHGHEPEDALSRMARERMERR